MTLDEALELITDHPGDSPLSRAARVVAEEYQALAAHAEDVERYVSMLHEMLDDTEETT